MLNKARLLLLGLVVVATVTKAQQKPPPWVTEGPYVETPSFSLELPLEVLANKLYVEVEMGGKPRHFVFDTGSPSMMSATLAAELGLQAVDTREGKDSHGAIIKSNIVQTEMVLGGVKFNKVPVFAVDYSNSEIARCLIGDGVLGSEVLPLCAWQIDLSVPVLRCNSDLKGLRHVKKKAKQRLYHFGYPHMPLVDIHFAEAARSKAMFDTGSPEYFTISPQDFEGAKGARGIGKTISGYGSLGGSMGGQAPNGHQVRAELKSLSIGHLDLGRVVTTMRESPPSLIGASILKHFIVTLDARSDSAYFVRYDAEAFDQSSFGFALAFDRGAVQVSLVWEGSPAANAGLGVGQRLTSINGAKAAASCDGMQRALRAMSGKTIDLTWEGSVATLSRRVPIFQ